MLLVEENEVFVVGIVLDMSDLHLKDEIQG